jgi:hypothetical protein
MLRRVVERVHDLLPREKNYEPLYVEFYESGKGVTISELLRRWGLVVSLTVSD